MHPAPPPFSPGSRPGGMSSCVLGKKRVEWGHLSFLSRPLTNEMGLRALRRIRTEFTSSSQSPAALVTKEPTLQSTDQEEAPPTPPRAVRCLYLTLKCRHFAARCRINEHFNLSLPNTCLSKDCSSDNGLQMKLMISCSLLSEREFDPEGAFKGFNLGALNIQPAS